MIMVHVEKLTGGVRKFPVLYDQSSEKYRNVEYKKKVWKIIATNLEVEGKSKILCASKFFMLDVDFNKI
jgi:hypothetical protein